MLSAEALKIREPLWVALSGLFLDTEPDAADFERMAHAVRASGLSPAEIDTVLWDELFPVLAPNLLSVAGQWGYFDEEWLRTRITAYLEQPRQHSRKLPRIHPLRAVHTQIAADWKAIAAHLPAEFSPIAE